MGGGAGEIYFGFLDVLVFGFWGGGRGFVALCFGN